MEYKHNTVIINDIEIDEGIKDLIIKLWENNIRTYSCCQGGILDPNEWDYDDFVDEDGNIEEEEYYLNENNELCEYAHIIIHKDDLEKFKIIFNNEFEIIEGSNGYMLEWIENLPDQKDLLYLFWETE